MQRSTALNIQSFPSDHYSPSSSSSSSSSNSVVPKNILERCFLCGEPTERAGRYEDSLYDEDHNGPYCESCWDQHEPFIGGHNYD